MQTVISSRATPDFHWQTTQQQQFRFRNLQGPGLGVKAEQKRGARRLGQKTYTAVCGVHMQACVRARETWTFQVTKSVCCESCLRTTAVREKMIVGWLWWHQKLKSLVIVLLLCLHDASSEVSALKHILEITGAPYSTAHVRGRAR